MGRKNFSVQRIDFCDSSVVKRKGFPYHLNTASWDYGRNHALPLWTEFVIDPAIHPEGCKYAQSHTTQTSFELVLEGRMVIVREDSRKRLGPMDLCLIPAGSAKVLEVRENCRKIVFGICGRLHFSLLAMLGILSREVIHLEKPERILQLLRELHHFLKEKQEESVPAVAARTMELVMEIGREAKRTPEPVLADALRFLEYHLSEPLQLQILEEKLHLTSDGLNRLFRKEFGIPPKRYLIEQRMLLAHSLLKSTTLSVQEISQKCGYKSQFSFSREFRKKYGVPPREVREQENFEKKI